MTRSILLFLWIVLALPLGAAAQPGAATLAPGAPGSLAAREAWIQSQQREAGSEYAFETRRDGLHARVPLQAAAAPDAAASGELRARFDARQGRFEAPSGLALSLSLAAYGRRGAMLPIGPVAPTAEGNALRYRREGIEHWIVSGPLGFEEGFVIDARPAGRGALRVELRAEHRLEASISATADAISFCNPEGACLRYSDLYVRDARGAAIPARMGLRGDRIELLVEDEAALYPLVVDPLISQQFKILAVGALPSDQFGAVASMDGTTVAISLTRPVGGAQSAVSVLELVEGAWIEQARLVSPVGAFGDGFGLTIDLQGDTLAVGAPADAAGGAGAGAVYVFVRSAGIWTQEAQILSPAARLSEAFGTSIALDGDTLVAGAPSPFGADPGAAYVFVRSAGAWSPQGSLAASDGGFADRFGNAVAVSADTVLVGAYRDDAPMADAGSAYVFVRSGTSWSEQAKLQPADAGLQDLFGSTVAIDGDTAMVGAIQEDGLANDSGAVYVFMRSGGSWSEDAKIMPPDGRAMDHFGSVIDLAGDRVLFGIPHRDGVGMDSGVAYFFTRSAGIWAQDRLLEAEDAAAQDRFGAGVGWSGERIAIGAPGADEAGTEAGAVYLYRPVWTLGDPCDDPATCGTGFCVDGVCCESDCLLGEPNDCMGCSVAVGGLEDGRCELLGVGRTCRPAIDLCDMPEFCDGAAVECPLNSYVPPGQLCRPAVDSCDRPEVCTGWSTWCPRDEMESMCSVVDAGMMPDAAADAGTPPPAEDGGCGCRLEPGAGDRGPGPRTLALLGLLGLLGLMRLRRPARRRP